MIDFAPTPQLLQRPRDMAAVMERLNDIAREVEEAGLPWAAARIRDAAGVVTAERELVEALRA